MDIRSRVPIGEAVIAGTVAWLVLNVFVYAAAPIFGVSLNLVARFFGSFLLPGASASVQMWLGRAMFLGAALGWSLLYRRVGHLLTGAGWLRGFLFGTGIWLVSALFLPLIGSLHPLGGNVGASALGRAPFPGWLGLGFDGTAGVALSILAHQAFGLTLGAMSGIQEPGD